MFRIRLVPVHTAFTFIRFRRIAFLASGLCILASIALLLLQGLNFGIDFRGGVLIEVRTEEAADIGAMRSSLSDLGLGDVSLQEFGDPRDVLIRIGQSGEGDVDAVGMAETVRAELTRDVGPVEVRRREFVGPQVSAELIRDGLLALGLALCGMMVYIWLRFEWQFGLAAVLALAHDVMLTLGLFALIQLEFNLSIIAAILTIVGYSINDTVVVFDRIRENLRKYRSKDLPELLDVSVNDTLSRTVMTSGTTLLALFALFIFGGEVIRGFTFAMIWGIVIGTYSSIFIASPLLIYLGVHRGAIAPAEAEKAG